MDFTILFNSREFWSNYVIKIKIWKIVRSFTISYNRKNNNSYWIQYIGLYKCLIIYFREKRYYK